ncbi:MULTISPECIES: hypothetical protein [unclassified Saccharopolyspora]|uniref:hypothetical protein n=1 Tax=unclassified Saccharopolyspora TaxID=2646250 RepID=UPI001CD40079|nr:MULTISPECIES: hypothetical protein [unclassified Saccharopolyspora]MCA1190010.1 hypothetical protein [Saccharopolyspora sp. 6T]MCA1194609.1 hypothetical protein [Saccharopolyspora sp. 6V]MCA1224933.1 hypothetical protein [Saccharopolyspora sp. 6M]MCA1279719.1 hypothetical protein [Saccharopolyspora sp. 7B]
MADAFIPAVIPRSLSGVAASGAKPGRSMPVPDLAASPGEIHTVYRIASIDQRGRIAERSVVQALGWCPGERLQFGLISESVIAVLPDPAGMFSLARRHHIPLPVTARRWCHLQTADRVLLAAAPQHGRLVIYTMSALDAMVTASHSPAPRGDA